MIYLKCSDVCSQKCNHVIAGSSRRVVIRTMMLHGEKKHWEIMDDLDEHSRDFVVRKMHTLIKST